MTKAKRRASKSTGETVTDTLSRAAALLGCDRSFLSELKAEGHVPGGFRNGRVRVDLVRKFLAERAARPRSYDDEDVTGETDPLEAVTKVHRALYQLAVALLRAKTNHGESFPLLHRLGDALHQQVCLPFDEAFRNVDKSSKDFGSIRPMSAWPRE